MRNLYLRFSTLFRLPVLLLLLALSAHHTFAQFNASFVATSATSGCSPLIVGFNGSASTVPSGVKYFVWDFGNGNTASGVNLFNPSAAYTVPGTYTVKLTISNGGSQNNTQTRAGYVTVFAKPTAAINTNSPKTGCAPLTINFNDITKLGSAPITSWTWDFGGGSSSTLQNPTYSYPTAGQYDVSLVVRDANGCQSNVLMKQYIQVGSKLPVDFTTTGPTVSCATPFLVNFKDNTNLTGFNGPFTYLWDFGDGQTSTQKDPSHTYTAFGSYNVTLTIVDQATNCSATIAKPNYVNLYNETISIGGTAKDGCAPLGVNFTGIINTTPATTRIPGQTIQWNFGTGNPADNVSGTSDQNNIKNPYFQYSNPGTYTVTFQTTGPDASCNKTVTQTNFVTVRTKPTNLTVTANPRNSCSAPATVTFNGSATDGMTYFWRFGDGSTSTSQNPTHQYNSSGNYRVVFYASNATGCSDSIVLNNYIRISAPVVNFTADPLTGCTPTIVNFTDRTNSIDPITGWSWNFGDGSPLSTEQNPSHTYTVAGIYTVTLTVTTANGCPTTLTRNAYINIGEKPDATIAPATPFTTCNPNTVRYTNASVGTADYYIWEPFPGVFVRQDTKQNLNYPFNDIYPGDYGVNLYAFKGGCSDTFRLNYTITVLPNVANFRFNVPQCTADTIRFTDQSAETPTSPNIKWHWDFGTGNPRDTSNVRNAKFFYTTPGNYPVTLNVKNANGCEDYVTLNVTIPDYTPPAFGINANPTTGCAPLSVSFSNTTTGITSQSWNFGNGTFSSQRNPSITYLEPGTYSVTLSVVNNRGCRFTKIYPDLIQVYGPIANFDFCPAAGCLPFQLKATDLSSSNSKIISRVWDMGNGTISGNDSIVTRTYTSLLAPPKSPKDGIPIKLTVRDAQGCQDVVQGLIRPSQPKVDFTYRAIKLCDRDSVIFNAINVDSTGVDPFRYFWDFGDGTSSTASRPTKIFPEGLYAVTLTITDANGCVASKAMIYIVAPVPPVADFCAFAVGGNCPPKVDSIVASCPPLTVQFKDLSIAGRTGIVSWLWDFGDGTTSSLRNPTRTYSVPGTFDIKLTITDSAGCVRSIILPKLIKIKGPNARFEKSKKVTCNGSAVDFVGIPLPPTTGTVTYAWDFGDGIVANGNPVSHFYTKPGIKYPTLIYTDESGNCTRTYTDTLNIIGLPLVKLGKDTSFCNGLSVTITASVPGANYSWNTGQTSPSIIVKQTGAYIVTVTDPVTNCKSLDTVNVTVNPRPRVTATIKNDVACTTIGQPTGKIYLSVTGADGPYNYYWTNNVGQVVGSNVDSLVNVYAGVYSVRVVNKFSCDTLLNIVIVNQPSSYKLRILSITDAATCGGKGQIAVRAVADLGKIILPFDTITLYDDKNQVVEQRLNYLPPIGDMSGYQVIGTQKQADSLTLYFTVDPGIYSVVTLDSALGYCPKFIGPVKVSPPPKPVVELGPNLTSCDPTFILNAPLLADHDYLWTGPTGGILTSPILPSITVGTTGQYKLQVTDTITLCSTRDSLIVTFYNRPGADIGKDVDTCVYNTIVLNVATQTGSSFNWYKIPGVDPISNETSITLTSNVLDSTYYAIMVRDTLTGCISTDSIKVKFTPLPIAALSDSARICFGDVITIPGTAIGGSGNGYVYSWTSNPPGFTASTKDITVSPSVGTTNYTLIVTDANNCVSSPAISKVVTTSLPIPDAGLDQNICTGKSTTIEASATSGTPAYTFIWNTETTGPDTLTQQVVGPLATTKYYLNVIDSLGCKGIDSLTVTVNSLPVAATSLPDTICANASAILQGFASGGSNTGYDFTWSSVPAGFTSNMQNPTVSPEESTLYELLVKDSNGCESAKAQTTITINYIPSVFAGLDTVICLNGIAKFTARPTGGGTGAVGPPNYTFSWTTSTEPGFADPDFVPVTTQFAIASPKAPGHYKYIVAVNDDRNSCPSADSVSLTVNDLPIAYAGEDIVTCKGNQVQLSGDGANGGKYIWYAAFQSFSFMQTATATASSDTTFRLVVIDRNGCTSEDTVAISTYDKPNLALQGNKCLAPGQSNQLLAHISPASTVPNAKYYWFFENTLQDTLAVAPAIDSTFGATDKGNYKVVFGFDRCIVSDSITLTLNPVANAGPDRLICFNGEAQLDASATGDYPPFKYTWTANPDLSSTTIPDPKVNPPAVAAGYTYSVFVTDSLGCQSPLDNALVRMLPPLNLTISNPPACIGDPITMTAGTDSLYTNATYQWYNNRNAVSGATAPGYTVTNNGTYSVKFKVGECIDSTGKAIIFNVKPIPDNKDKADFCYDEVRLQNDPSYVPETKLDAGPATAWYWYPNPIAGTGSSTERTLSVPKPALYYFDIINEFSCKTLDSILLVSICPPRIYIPDAFTPNGDGNNDNFDLSAAYIKNFKMWVFNRWGEIIYYTENIPGVNNNGSGWDGNYKGEPMPMGTYPWLLEYDPEFPGMGGTQKREGKVTLIR